VPTKQLQSAAETPDQWTHTAWSVCHPNKHAPRAQIRPGSVRPTDLAIYNSAMAARPSSAELLPGLTDARWASVIDLEGVIVRPDLLFWFLYDGGCATEPK